ncbi:MAG: hypothetical protein CVV32_00260 [Methanomicrobiales archaeon HGW-Methanomicrobiales-3]|nr:MAG: hypothetical protein CVV32_00260 [Methanomicrobiales archaeon HGW-Methanomicrobiales-3]
MSGRMAGSPMFRSAVIAACRFSIAASPNALIRSWISPSGAIVLPSPKKQSALIWGVQKDGCFHLLPGHQEPGQPGTHEDPKEDRHHHRACGDAGGARTIQGSRQPFFGTKIFMLTHRNRPIDHNRCRERDGAGYHKDPQIIADHCGQQVPGAARRGRPPGKEPDWQGRGCRNEGSGARKAAVRRHLGTEAQARVIGGNRMDEERTLLQQIRQKEQEFAEKLAVVKKETDREVEAARDEAEALLCTADSSAKTEAERLYWEGKGKIEAAIGELRQEALAERTAAAAKGERNIPRAVEAITGYVTME